MPSESPYDRHGEPVDEPRREREVQLYGGARENALTVAHRGAGEWRQWRRMLERNGIDRPFDLTDRIIEPTEVDLLDDEGDETGYTVTLHHASFDLSGPVHLGGDPLDSVPRIRIPGDNEWGQEESAVLQEGGDNRLILKTHKERYFVDFTLSDDALDWVQDVDNAYGVFEVQRRRTRSSLHVPQLDLEGDE